MDEKLENCLSVSQQKVLNFDLRKVRDQKVTEDMKGGVVLIFRGGLG